MPLSPAPYSRQFSRQRPVRLLNELWPRPQQGRASTRCPACGDPILARQSSVHDGGEAYHAGCMVRGRASVGRA